MTRLLVVFALLISAVSTFAAEKINIVFIGNSITYGATLPDPKTQAPPVRVKEILSQQLANQINIANCGHSGSTTVDWLPGSRFFNQAFDAAKAFEQQGGQLYFLLMLGTNDSASQGPTGSPVSLADYKANMQKIIDTLRQTYPKARFIINYPIWYSLNTHNGATYLEDGLNRMVSYHGAITELGAMYAKKKAPVYLGQKKAYTFFENNIPLLTREPGYDGYFFLHPNVEGAVKLAEIWTESILDYAKDVAVKAPGK